MTEDRTWLRDPVFLERQRQQFADLRRWGDALAAWFVDAHERVARIERELERRKTAALGHFEPNDEPGEV